MIKGSLTGVRVQYAYARSRAVLNVRLMDDLYACVPQLIHDPEVPKLQETVLMHCAIAAYIRNFRNKVLMYPSANGELHVLGAVLTHKDSEHLRVTASPIHRRYGLVSIWLPDDIPLFFETLTIHALVRYDRLT